MLKWKKNKLTIVLLLVKLQRKPIPTISLAYCYQKKGKYTILTEELKVQCIEDPKTMTISEVPRKYNVSKRSINRWRSNGAERKKGSGRKFRTVLNTQSYINKLYFIFIVSKSILLSPVFYLLQKLIK